MFVKDFCSSLMQQIRSSGAFAWCLGAVLCTLQGAPLLAQSTFDSQQFDRYLSSGEFAPAQRMAQALADSGQRDAALSRLATAQRSMGLHRQADRTIATVRSADAFRSFLAQELPGGPAGSGLGAGGFMGAAPGGRGAMAGRGGMAQADFDPLIELIQATIEPGSWEETAGGAGTIEEFAAGVHIDPRGRLERIAADATDSSLAALRRSAAESISQTEVNRESMLRMVSLTRLERAVQARLAQGQSPTEVMKHLAGLRRIEAVFVYPETGDLVIAGPAGAWEIDGEARAIHRETGEPVLLLDDLVDCLRAMREGDGIISCSIDPRPENLRATQEYLANNPGSGKRWQEGLRAALGTQVITTRGLQPDSHASLAIIAADYHMKLIGMGIEPGVLGVVDVLSLIGADPEARRDTSVIRWWFSLNYDHVVSTEDRLAFRLEGPAARVLSEDEHLSELGERVHTGRSEGPSADFAQSFTRHFESLSQKYPVYGELRNVFDLAMVCGLIDRFKLDEQVAWDRGCFRQSGDGYTVYELRSYGVPREVETVMNVKEMTRRAGGRTTRETVLGVSGGVHANIREHLSSTEVTTDNYQVLDGRRSAGTPASWDANQWWWDSQR